MANTTSQLDNDIYSFSMRLSKSMEDLYYFKNVKNFWILENSEKSILDAIASATSPLRYELPSLNGRIQSSSMNQDFKKKWANFTNLALDKDPKARKIQKIYTNLIKKKSSNDIPEKFRKTDLIIFPDSEEEIPKYGIKKSEIKNLLSLYSSFTKKLKFDYNLKKYPLLFKDVFKHHIQHDIRMLLSRPMGRLLIHKINDLISGEITIKANEKFNYDSAEGHVIGFGVSPDITFSEVAPNDIRSISDPTYITLAHELIHLLHELENSRRSHVDDPDLPPYYSNPEEMRTINGYCKCHGVHKISEKSLRPEFNLFQRHTHLEASWPNADPKDKLAKGIQVGAHQDVVDAIPTISSPNLDDFIDEIIDSNKTNEVENLVQFAINDASIRKGKYLRNHIEIPPLVLNQDDGKVESQVENQKSARENIFSTIVERVRKRKSPPSLSSGNNGAE